MEISEKIIHFPLHKVKKKVCFIYKIKIMKTFLIIV